MSSRYSDLSPYQQEIVRICWLLWGPESKGNLDKGRVLGIDNFGAFLDPATRRSLARRLRLALEVRKAEYPSLGVVVVSNDPSILSEFQPDWMLDLSPLKLTVTLYNAGFWDSERTEPEKWDDEERWAREVDGIGSEEPPMLHVLLREWRWSSKRDKILWRKALNHHHYLNDSKARFHKTLAIELSWVETPEALEEYDTDEDAPSKLARFKYGEVDDWRADRLNVKQVGLLAHSSVHMPSSDFDQYREGRLFVIPEFRGLGLSSHASDALGRALLAIGAMFQSNYAHEQVHSHRTDPESKGESQGEWRPSTMNEQAACTREPNERGCERRPVEAKVKFSMRFWGQEEDRDAFRRLHTGNEKVLTQFEKQEKKARERWKKLEESTGLVQKAKMRHELQKCATTRKEREGAGGVDDGDAESDSDLYQATNPELLSQLSTSGTPSIDARQPSETSESGSGSAMLAAPSESTELVDPDDVIDLSTPPDLNEACQRDSCLDSDIPLASCGVRENIEREIALATTQSGVLLVDSGLGKRRAWEPIVPLTPATQKRAGQTQDVSLLWRAAKTLSKDTPESRHY